MKLLHLEDNPLDAELVRTLLAGEFANCSITVVATRDEFAAQLTAHPPDCVLSDFTLPAFSGLQALEIARARAPHIPFVFVSGTIGEERAVEAARAGAYDYVIKDRMQRLPLVLRRALADSAQRRTLRAVEETRRQLVDVIDHATEAIVVTDLAARIQHWNHGAARLFGVPAATAIGRLLTEVLTLPELVLFKPPRAIHSDEWRDEASLEARDGRTVVVEIHATLITDSAGEPRARLTIATDVTEKKKLEAQLLRAQRLECVGLLAAGIAHDLNNVLSPVLLATPLLRQHATAATDLQMIDILEASAKRGAGLVRQILAFSHGAGNGLQPVPFRHLFRELREFLGASLPKSIAIEERIAPDLWPFVGDATQVHQVLLNLCVNARDAMLPRGGTLRLGAANCPLTGAAAAALEGGRPGDFVVFEVADTGSGMPPEVLARIWEPFFTTKAAGHGTGLGLSTVRGIIARHHGFITVETAVGRGTTFRFYLPAAEARGPEPAASQSPFLPRGSGELILVVDDEPSVCEVACRILTQFGYRAFGCRDGAEALTYFTAHAADVQLVITDVNMPNLDGPSLAHVLQRLRPDLKLLVMTGLERGDTSDQLNTAPFSARLQKPFTAQQLLLTVGRVLPAAPKK